MGQAGCPGREPDCLKPAGTWVGVSALMYNDLNSLGDRAMEGRGSERMHTGTGEGISARIHVANSHEDRAEDSEGRRSDRKFVVGEGRILHVNGGQHSLSVEE